MAPVKPSLSNVVRVGFFAPLLATAFAQASTAVEDSATVNGSTADRSIVQQGLEVSPPLPILQIGLDYILGQIGANATVAGNISHAKDVAQARQAGNPDFAQAAAPAAATSDTPVRPRRAGFTRYVPLNKRAVEGPIQCSSSKPCADASCCNSDGKCGFKAYNCKPAAPVTCLSNCNAKAMCGIDSAGGSVKCGLNLCCSFYGWCGTQDVHCTNADPIGKTAPCQQGFGGCTIVPPPSCGTGSGTASNGRKIAYYQSWNTRNRACNRIAPSQIKTAGLTHLNFAFANIDPVSFAVVPADPGDVALFTQFTALQTASLKTWIAIGGFDFSDPGPTHTTWSDMVSTSANRAKFISSLVAFMAKYKFQGADLDWEYPASPERGGKPADTANLVLLVKELRAAFGTTYGLSVILAPDYWYLRGTDPKGMEPYVDWFGFMAYDLHGAWDSNVPTLGSIIRPQTDLREITNNTVPLWFDKLNPAKVNLGLAYYGRGFTVPDPKCAYPGCPFSGPSKPAPCTNNAGVMSNREISQLIASKGLYVEFLKDPAIKMISWDDQWMGFDDADTIALKTQFANSRCMGGTMIWSVDFDSGAGSGDTPSPPSSSPKPTSPTATTPKPTSPTPTTPKSTSPSASGSPKPTTSVSPPGPTNSGGDTKPTVVQSTMTRPPSTSTTPPPPPPLNPPSGTATGTVPPRPTLSGGDTKPTVIQSTMTRPPSTSTSSPPPPPNP